MTVLIAEARTGDAPAPQIKLVIDRGRVVADATVIVSPGDPNWWRGMAVRTNGEIRVRSEAP